MAYERVSGTIEAVARTGKQIKLGDGEWYSAFALTQLLGAVVGDTVEFDMEEKSQGGKTFLNIKGDVVFLDGGGQGDAPPAREPARAPAARGGGRPAPRGSSAPARGGRGGGSAPAREAAPAASQDARGGRPMPEGRVTDEARQQSIQRQVALKEGVTAAVALNTLSADPQGFSAESLADDALYFAERFSAFLNA
jgi:hypothetical protein